MWATSDALRAEWEVEDLVQEVLLRALARLDQFQGKNGSSLATWVGSVARTHIVSMARAASRARRFAGSDSANAAREEVTGYRWDLREATKGLLASLEDDGVPWGWEALNLCLKYQADWNRVALALTVHTGEAWTPERVRKTIERVERTEQGQALVGVLGVRAKR